MLSTSIPLGPKSGDTVQRKYKHVHHRMVDSWPKGLSSSGASNTYPSCFLEEVGVGSIGTDLVLHGYIGNMSQRWATSWPTVESMVQL